MIEEVVRRVQRNCDISDANHGGNFTMCTYLMKMREYFRWEKGLAFTDRLPDPIRRLEIIFLRVFFLDW